LQYSNIKNDYELTMRESTEIIPCTEDTSDVPSITFNFCKIADLNASLKDQVVDILGICKSATDVQTITSQKLNKVIVHAFFLAK
jgi:replication factor A1